MPIILNCALLFTFFTYIIHIRLYLIYMRTAEGTIIASIFVKICIHPWKCPALRAIRTWLKKYNYDPEDDLNVYGSPVVRSEAEKPSTSAVVSTAVPERTQVSDYIVYIVWKYPIDIANL